MMRQTFADSASAYREAVATAEIDRSYAGSGLVRGDANDHLAPGDLLPNAIPVQTASGNLCALHELTHHLGHTILVIGGRDATSEDVAADFRNSPGAIIEIPHLTDPVSCLI